MGFTVLGMGTAVPEHSISQPEAAEVAGRLACADTEQQRHLKRLYQLTGVERRHSVVLRHSVTELVVGEEVNAVARQVLSSDYGAAVLGPHRSKKSLPPALRSITA